MDLQMPLLGGLEAARRIRALPRHHDMPIIAMTAATSIQDQEASREAGMDDFISKPFDIDQLLEVLMRWLKPLDADATQSGDHQETASQSKKVEKAHQTVQTDGSFSIPGLALEDAARRMNNNWSLLRKVVDSFKADCRVSIDELSQYIDAEAWEEAHRLVHTVKSLARTIGANKLADICVELESELKAHQTDSVEVFKTELAKVLASLGSF
jgi:DNA-binding response OmpR family regulator